MCDVVIVTDACFYVCSDVMTGDGKVNIIVKISTLVKTFLWGFLTGMVFAVVLTLICERWIK